MSVWILRHTILVWFGIFLNALFIIPLLFFPRWMLDLFNIPLDQLVWARESAGLLMIISVFYIPAAIDFGRYRANAYIACLCFPHVRCHVFLLSGGVVRTTARVPVDFVR